ncbi:nucleoside/nucleotide kinase family protein [Flindersiella endophytica]
MRVRPITFDALVDELAERIARVEPEQRIRVVVDGPPAGRPETLADALVAPLRLRGREVLRASAWDFLRAASLRFERGKDDPDAFYEDWLDWGGLRRELLDPVEPGESGRVLPALWDVEAERATRASYVTVPPNGVVVLDGALLLGNGLPIDFAVHLSMSPAALERQTEPDNRWTLPAYARYTSEVLPAETADAVVLWDHPERPALVED